MGGWGSAGVNGVGVGGVQELTGVGVGGGLQELMGWVWEGSAGTNTGGWVGECRNYKGWVWVGECRS